MKKSTSKRKDFVLKLKKHFFGNILTKFSKPKEPSALFSCLFYLFLHIYFYFPLFYLFTYPISIFFNGDKLQSFGGK